MSGWRARPVVELDATADKCLFLDEDGGRMCRHVDDDPACLITRYRRREESAVAAVQTILFLEPLPCPACGQCACPCDERCPDAEATR